MAGDGFIQFSHVSKDFPLAGNRRERLHALVDVNLTVDRGEFISVVGASGSGKTTLLKLISGIFTPTAGEVLIKGEPVHQLRRDTGNVFQKPILFPWRTVLRNILLPIEIIRGEVTGGDERRADELVSMMGLQGVLDLYPGELSGGMQQRIAIARALILDPEILLLDEPFGSLDSITRERLNILLLELWRKTGKTVVFVTHSISEAVLLSTRIVVLSSSPGRVQDVIRVDSDKKESADEIFSSRYISEAVVSIRSRIRSVWSREVATEVRRTPVRRAAGPKEKKGAGIEFVTRLGRRYEYLLIPAGLAFFVTLWFLLARLTGLPEYILPLPGTVLQRFFSAGSDGLLLPNMAVTSGESLLGFFFGSLSGFLFGYALAKYRTVERVLSPYIVAMQAIPIVSLAPLLIIWFGFGMNTKVLIAALIIFFPILINSIVGIRSADREIMELLTSLDAGPLKTFFKFELPSALPVIFGGLKVGITYSVIGAVIGEFLGASKGLGALMNMARASFDTALVFVSILLLGILGIFFYLMMSLLELLILKKRMKWKG